MTTITASQASCNTGYTTALRVYQTLYELNVEKLNAQQQQAAVKPVAQAPALPSSVSRRRYRSTVIC